MAEPTQIEADPKEFSKGFNSEIEETTVNSEEKKEVPVEEKPQTEAPVVEKKGEEKTQPEEKQPDAKVEDKKIEEKPDEKQAPAPDTYESKWKSLHGIVKSKDARILELQEELKKEKLTKTKENISEAKTEIEDDPVDALEAQVADALIDGKNSEAVKIRKQINKIIFDRAKAEIMASIDAKDAHTSGLLNASDENRAIEIVKDQAYKAYPYLNNEGPSANEAAIRFVRATAAEYHDSGMSRSEALSEAVKDSAKIPWIPVNPAALATEIAASSSSSSVNEEKLRQMAVVESKASPVRVDQKAKGQGTFSEGFNSEIKT